MSKPFLKWLGGKYRLRNTINSHIDGTKRLVDVFSGSGSIWSNSKSNHIIVNDINTDVIACFLSIQKNCEFLIESLEQLFVDGCSLESYLNYRDEFNASTDPFRRACLFIYMNKYGFNGLCRYNQKGKFNVHYGGLTSPISPPKMEIYNIRSLLKIKTVVFENLDFAECVEKYDDGNTFFYFDPPYVPPKKESFVNYSGGFGKDQHIKLRDLCINLKSDFLMSNSDTELTRDLYQDFKIQELEVIRSVSVDYNNRSSAKELLISNTELYNPSFIKMFEF